MQYLFGVRHAFDTATNAMSIQDVGLLVTLGKIKKGGRDEPKKSSKVEQCSVII